MNTTMQEQVLEYFNNYFGQHLNESISDDAIMDAVYDLIGLTEAVLESVEVDEGLWQDTKDMVRDVIRKPGMKAPKKGDTGFQPLIKKKDKDPKGVTQHYVKKK